MAAINLERLRRTVEIAKGGAERSRSPTDSHTGTTASPPAAKPVLVSGWLMFLVFMTFAIAANRFDGSDGPPPATGLQGKLHVWFYYVSYMSAIATWDFGGAVWTTTRTLSTYSFLNLTAAVVTFTVLLHQGWRLLRWLLWGGAWVLWILYGLPAIALAGLWGWERVFAG